MTRDQKMAKRREAGKTYKYVALDPNSRTYERDKRERLNKNDKRTNKNLSLAYGAGRRLMAKLDNELLAEKAKKVKKSDKAEKTA